MADSDLANIGFIGAGRTGSTLALALTAAGYPVVAVASRTYAHAQRLAGQIPGAAAVETAQAVADAASLVFITTPDDVIAQVASQVTWRSGQAAVHCSGVLALDSLAPATAQGARTGSFHPVYTFGSTETAAAQALRGAAFGVEGDPALLGTLSQIAQRLGGFAIQVPPEARSLYHAAAVLVCGYFVGLFHDAAGLWHKGGLPKELAYPALAHLVRATLDNLVAVGAEASQTGPVPRGDVGTVQAHLQTLGEQAPELLPVYTALAGRALELAVATGRQPASSLPAWRELLGQPKAAPAVGRQASRE